MAGMVAGTVTMGAGVVGIEDSVAVAVAVLGVVVDAPVTTVRVAVAMGVIVTVVGVAVAADALVGADPDDAAVATLVEVVGGVVAEAVTTVSGTEIVGAAVVDGMGDLVDVVTGALTAAVSVDIIAVIVGATSVAVGALVGWAIVGVAVAVSVGVAFAVGVPVGVGSGMFVVAVGEGVAGAVADGDGDAGASEVAIGECVAMAAAVGEGVVVAVGAADTGLPDARDVLVTRAAGRATTARVDRCPVETGQRGPPRLTRRWAGAPRANCSTRRVPVEPLPMRRANVTEMVSGRSRRRGRVSVSAWARLSIRIPTSRTGEAVRADIRAIRWVIQHPDRASSASSPDRWRGGAPTVQVNVVAMAGGRGERNRLVGAGLDEAAGCAPRGVGRARSTGGVTTAVALDGLAANGRAHSRVAHSRRQRTRRAHGALRHGAWMSITRLIELLLYSYITISPRQYSRRVRGAPGVPV